MDAFLAIASRREVRDYTSDPVSEEALQRILEAGRIAGSGRNWQPCRFIVIETRGVLDALAPAVSRSTNLLWAPLAVAIVVSGPGPLAFDGGRAAQNMMLAAWNDGIGGCPNGITDEPLAREVLAIEPESKIQTVISFGHPLPEREKPDARSPEEWLARAKRLSLDELVIARI